MKLLSGIVGAALASVVALASANAADVYSGPAGGLKDVPALGVNWGGLYFGAHVGGAWGDDEVTDVNGFAQPAGYKFDNGSVGVFGGGQGGYNFQRGNFVFGAEIDAGGMDLSGSKAEPDTVVVLPHLASSRTNGGFYMDVTGRLGYAIGSALIYAKGGWAYWGGSEAVTSTSPTDAAAIATGTGGWTAGGGIEYKINPTMGLKVEYLHFDFGSSNVELASTKTYYYTNALEADTVKAGINFYIGASMAPLK